jgi:sortase A
LKIWSIASKTLEKSLLVAGTILLSIYGVAFLHQKISAHVALWQFKQTVAAQEIISTPLPLKDSEHVDFGLWAQKRIQAYRNSLLKKVATPVAVLEISKVQLQAPVFDGTDDLTLNRGVGRIMSTAQPGTFGNIGIAGHRDGFFRRLKDIAVGDAIDLVTTRGRVTYIVDQLEIVSPSDVSVLQSQSVPSLTLITCYPFYFVGDAPQRFIVRASMASVQADDHLHFNTSRFNPQESTR